METNQYGYARMPRIIRKGYKHLTKLQKLLYIYLRDLCGESGTCYRSLRTLAEETDFSIGFLSENIPLLEQAGLIRAEKKKHNNQKWEIWHITIVDIWEENAKFLQDEKCSQDEQITNVHGANCSSGEQNTPESVHGMNEISQKCSRGANKKEKNLNKNPLLTEKESTLAPATSSILSSDQQMWFEEVFCKSKIGRVPPKIDELLRDRIATLMRHIENVEELDSLYDYAKREIEESKKKDKTVHLGNLVNSRTLNGWLQSREVPTTPEEVSPIEEIEPSGDMLIFGRSATYWTEERIAKESPLRQEGIRMLLGQEMERACTNTT